VSDICDAGSVKIIHITPGLEDLKIQVELALE
jgi:hypothetical protein